MANFPSQTRTPETEVEYRNHTLGYNDFLKGGLYRPAPDEDENAQPDFAARRAHWSRNNPGNSDARVLRERTRRASRG